MKNGMLLWPLFLRQPIGKNLHTICKAHGMDNEYAHLVRFNNQQEFFDHLEEYDNAVCWRYHHAPFHFYSKACKNILYVDNGLIDAEGSYYMDSFGFFGSSSIALKEHNREPISKFERDNLYDYLELHGYQTKGGDEDGYILLIMQHDLNMLYYCWHMLPEDIPVRIMTHPLNRGITKFKSKSLCEQRENWELLDGVPLQECLDGARAVVSMFSHDVVRAIAMGIPCATLARGTFSRSGATLECWKEVQNLRNILDFQPDRTNIDQYLHAVMRSEVSSEISLPDLSMNKQLCLWLTRGGFKDQL